MPTKLWTSAGVIVVSFVALGGYAVSRPCPGTVETFGSCDRNGSATAEATPDPGAHEPPGFRTIRQVRFDAEWRRQGLFFLQKRKTLALSQRWQRSPSQWLQVDEDSTSPGSPPSVARVTFPAGLGDGRAPAWLETEVAEEGADRLYLSFWSKVSDGWQGHGSGVNKILYVWLHGNPVVYLLLRGADDAALTPEIGLQGLPGVEVARNLVPNRSEVTVARGEWHRWEVVLATNDPGRLNGVARWWIDGQKVGEYDDVGYSDPLQERVWERVAWRPVWGGRGGTIRKTMWMWMDDLYVSGE